MPSSIRRCNAALLEPPTIDALERPALLMVEGGDSDGDKWTKANLRRIAKATTEYIESGNRVIFTKDHGATGNCDYKSDDIMGRVLKVWTDTITPDLLPHSGMKDLVGKLGIFGLIAISGEDNITRYRDGRIKEISVGLDLGGDLFGKDVIFEVSAVWKGAIRGASLFGLTLDGTIAESKHDYHTPELDNLLRAFAQTATAIQQTTDAELNGRTRPDLTSQAIDDLELKLRDLLGATRVLPSPPTFSQSIGGDMPDDVTPEVITPESGEVVTASVELEVLKTDNAVLKAEIEALKLQQASAQRVSDTRLKWAALRERGHALCAGSEPRMTPAAFKSYFGGTAQESEDLVLKYAKPLGEEGALNLATVEAVISHLEQFGQPITRMGSLLAEEPLQDRGDAADIASQVAALKRFAADKNLSKDRAIGMLSKAVSQAAIDKFRLEA